MMPSEWISNDKTSNRIKELLEQAGIPLEIQAINICSQFCEHHRRQQIFAEPVIYTNNPNPQVMRQVDYKVQIYDAYLPKINDYINLDLELNIPIECKYRKDIEVFGFPLDTYSTHQLFFDNSFGFPVSSYYAKTDYLHRISKSYKVILKSQPLRTSLIKIEGGRKPIKTFDEDIIYNATSSLYDFIQMDITENINSYLHKYDDEVVLNNLVKRYIKEYSSVGDDWFIDLRLWAEKNISNNDINQFNKANKKFNITIKAYLPVIFMNGPLYVVDMLDTQNINSFNEKMFLCTSIRKHGWFNDYNSFMVFDSPEVCVFITNPSGLSQILEMGLNWYKNIRKILKTYSQNKIKRVPLEAAFYNKVIKYYTSNNIRPYRSDMDFRSLF